MHAWVLTVDQRSSRTAPDLVPAALVEHGQGALLPFERTAGDEMQGVFTDPPAVTVTLEGLIRSDAWNIGLGHGEIEEPLPTSARAGRGEAYLSARDAVSRAKHAPRRICVTGDDDVRAEQLETVLWLWGGLLARRTTGGWEVADLLDRGLSHQEAADTLGISQSAVTQRARAAGVAEGGRCRTLVTQLLEQMQPGTEQPGED